MAQVEPIDVREKRFNYFPIRFIWRGEPHHVRKVERVWTRPARGRWAARTYYRVRCLNDRVYHIFQDVLLNAWFLEQ